jgi:hypothetical protein
VPIPNHRTPLCGRDDRARGGLERDGAAGAAQRTVEVGVAYADRTAGGSQRDGAVDVGDRDGAVGDLALQASRDVFHGQRATPGGDVQVRVPRDVDDETEGAHVRGRRARAEGRAEHNAGRFRGDRHLPVGTPARPEPGDDDHTIPGPADDAEVSPDRCQLRVEPAPRLRGETHADDRVVCRGRVGACGRRYQESDCADDRRGLRTA